MFIRWLLSFITLLVGLEALALPTAALTPEQRQRLGQQLAEHASTSQWQQLWQRSRQAGHLVEHPTTPHFNLASAPLMEAVTLTLAQPDETRVVNQTQVLYRRDFGPNTVGKQANVGLSTVCLWIDWRTLPEHAVNRPAPYLGQISLLLARPCR